MILQVTLDVCRCVSSTRCKLDANAWIPHLSRISSLCFDENVDSLSRRTSSKCLVLALNIFREHRKDLIQLLTKQVADHYDVRPTPGSLRLGSDYPNPELTSALLEWSLRWLVGQTTEDAFPSTEDQYALEYISTYHTGQHLRSRLPTAPNSDTLIIKVSPIIKAPQVETLIRAVIQHHLSDATTVNLVTECISKTHLKVKSIFAQRHSSIDKF